MTISLAMQTRDFSLVASDSRVIWGDSSIDDSFPKAFVAPDGVHAFAIAGKVQVLGEASSAHVLRYLQDSDGFEDFLVRIGLGFADAFRRTPDEAIAPRHREIEVVVVRSIPKTDTLVHSVAIEPNGVGGSRISRGKDAEISLIGDEPAKRAAADVIRPVAHRLDSLRRAELSDLGRRAIAAGIQACGLNPYHGKFSCGGDVVVHMIER